MRVTAIIAAGGAGRRLGAAVPKQLLDVAGQSMLARSVGAFDRHPEVDDVIVALPADLVDECAGAIVGKVTGPIRVCRRRRDPAGFGRAAHSSW